MPNSIQIILCAGKSSRMGFPKGLFKYNGIELLKHHQQNWSKNIVVTGFYHEEYLPSILDHSKIIRNEDFEFGMFSSIQTALSETLEYDNFFITPVDTLPIFKAEFNSLQKNFQLDILKPTFNKKSGHPILISKSVSREILALDPKKSRLDLFLKDYLKQTQFLPINNENIITNINSLEDFRTLE